MDVAGHCCERRRREILMIEDPSDDDTPEPDTGSDSDIDVLVDPPAGKDHDLDVEERGKLFPHIPSFATWLRPAPHLYDQWFESETGD